MRRKITILVPVLAAITGLLTGPQPRALAQDEEAALSQETLQQLIEQHGALLAEAERMRLQMERLLRVARESNQDSVGFGDLAPVMAALSSEDYQERQNATLAMRRALVDRMWLLIETPDLDSEARMRMKSILVEASAMIRLTRVAADLESGERDALWNLLDAEPKWTLDALGDDPDRILEALRSPPPDHDLGAEIVLAALVRDEMRPLPQLIALNEIDDAFSPLLRSALLSLLKPRAKPQVRQNHHVSTNRDQTAALAVRILTDAPSRDLVGYLLACLKASQRFSARLDATIVESLVKLRAQHAAPTLLEIAKSKREGLSGGHGIQGLMIRPGDCELVGAAILMGMDLEELNIQVKKGWSERDPSYYGFVEPPKPKNPHRLSAFDTIEAAMEGVEPADSIPGFEEALEEFGAGQDR